MANVHDYAQVFLDGALVGTLDRRLGQREIDLPECAKEATLEILVEAWGISTSRSPWIRIEKASTAR